MSTDGDAPTSAVILSLVDRRPPEITWSPEQLLEEFLREIRAGTIKPKKMAVHFFEATPEGGLRARMWHANMSRAEQIALAFLMMNKGLDDWRS